MVEVTGTYRAPMRSRTVEADQFLGARTCVEHSLVGMGEPLARVPDDLDDALLMSTEEHGPKSERMLRRFAGLVEGSLVWTRTGEDEFRLGRISGPWRYEESAAGSSGICQVRPARWLPDSFNHATVPEPVAYTFSRGGRNFQRIRNRSAEDESVGLWRSANG